MKTSLFAALAGTALSIAAVQLKPQYKAGEIHLTTFTVESSSTMVDSATLMNGEAGPGMPDMEREESSKFEGQFRDSVTRVDGTDLVAFDREYLEIAEASSNHMSNPMMGDMDTDSEKTTPLDEATVHFTRGEDGFQASFPEDSSDDEELLDGLTGPLPFAALLPDDEVEVDDEWKIPVAVIWSFMEPGGDLSLEDDATPGDMPPGMLEVDPSTVAAELEGDCKASLKEIKEIDGVRHAVISLSLEFTRFQDLTEMMQAQADEAPDDMPEGAVMPDIDSMEVEAAFEGEGTLVWNLKTGVATSFEMSLDSERTETMLMSIEMGPESLEIEQTSVFEGETIVNFEVEVTHE